jgi:hypothetical protein
MENARPVGPPPTEHNPIEAALDHSIGLLVLPGRSILALIPIWAVLCGAWLALRDTQAPCAPQALLALLLAVSNVGVLWSTWRALLVDVDWQDCFQRYPLPAPGRLPNLPYATPWSPLGRFVTRAGRFRRWSEHAPVQVRSAWYSLLVLPALSLALSALAGWPLLALSLAALALSLIEWRVSRRPPRRGAEGAAHLSLQAGVQVGLGWLAGHTAFAPLTFSAVTLACCYAIAYQGALALAHPNLKAEHRGRPLLLYYFGQAAALGLLVALDRSLNTALAAFFLAPQWLLLAGLERRDAAAQPENTLPATAHAPPFKWYLQRALPFCMLAMLAAAWAPL